MKHRSFAAPALVAAALALAAIGTAHAADTPLGKQGEVLIALSAADVDPLKLLPPPPADGSEAQKAELARLREIQATRGEARLARARFDDAHEDATAFAAVLGPKFDLATLPATRDLLKIVLNDQAVAASMAKTAFHRHRPWIFDDSLTGCPRGKKADPLSSYPSGHATLGYSVGVVLADLVPTKAADLMARAGDYGYSRLVCEVHFPSDIVASEALGTAVGVLLIHAPALAPKFAAAAAELKAAGVE